MDNRDTTPDTKPSITLDTTPRNRAERRALEKKARRGQLPPRPPRSIMAGSGEPFYPGDTIVYSGFDDPNWF